MPSYIVKRLDIIKNAVSMGEDDLIALQVQKLEKLSLDEGVQHIFALISAQQFQDVIQLIEQYKHDSSGLSVYEDPQIQGLKLELKLLENRLNELTDTQADLEREINEFNGEYFRRLGGLIEKILKRRAELCRDETEKQQTQQDYEEFERGYQQQLEDAPQTLTHEELQELKTAFRKASRLCHPDKLADEFKARGEAFFKELHEAYRRQDLERVTEILTTLQTGKSLGSVADDVNNLEKLQAKIAALREQIAILEIEVKRLQDDEIYQQILLIDDRESYFSELSKELEIELTALKKVAT
jgi:cell division protein FtsB